MGIWCQKVTTFANVLRNYVFIAWFKAFEETTDFPPKGRWGRWSRRPEHILHFLQWIILLGQNFWILRIHRHIFSSTSMSWQDTGLYHLQGLSAKFVLSAQWIWEHLYTWYEKYPHNLHCNSWNLFNILSAVKQGSCKLIMWM